MSGQGGRRHKKKDNRPSSSHGRRNKSTSIATYFSTNDDGPSFGGNNNNSHNNERRQQQPAYGHGRPLNNSSVTSAARRNSSFLRDIPAIKQNRQTQQPQPKNNPLGVARDLQEQEKPSSSRSSSFVAEGVSGGGLFGVASDFLQKGVKALVDSVLSPSSSAKKRKRPRNQQFDSLGTSAANANAAASTTKKKKASSSTTINLCGGDSDTDGETIPPSPQQQQHKTIPATALLSLEEEGPNLRSNFKDSIKKSPNRSLLFDDDSVEDVDGPALSNPPHYRPTCVDSLPGNERNPQRTGSSSKQTTLPSYQAIDEEDNCSMDRTTRKDKRVAPPRPSSWNRHHRQNEEGEEGDREQTFRNEACSHFDQVMGVANTKSKVANDAAAGILRQIERADDSHTDRKKTPPLQLEFQKVNGGGSSRQDAIDSAKRAHLRERRKVLQPSKAPGDSHQPIELHQESDDDEEGKKVMMLSNMVARIPRKQKDSDNKETQHRVLETTTKPAASSERKRPAIRDGDRDRNEYEDDDFWSNKNMNSTKSSSPMPSALSGIIGLGNVLPSFGVTPRESVVGKDRAAKDSFTVKALAESIEQLASLPSASQSAAILQDVDGWTIPNSPKKGGLSFTKANQKKMPKKVVLKKGLPNSAKRTRPKRTIIPGTSLRPRSERDEERPKEDEPYEDSSFRSCSTRESSRDSRGWKHNDSSPDPTIFGRRKSKRLSKGIKKSPELIDMCSDSEEEGGEGSDQSVQVDLGAIAFGKKVHVHGCQATYSSETGVLTLDYETTKRGKQVKHTRELPLTMDTLRELKYYRCDVAPTEDDKSVPDIARRINFVALNIVPDDGGDLARLSVYKHDGPKIRKYILLEGDGQEIDYLVAYIRKSRLGELLSKLTAGEILSYTEAWLIHRKREQAQASHNAFLTGKNDDTLLVVYPFAGDQQEIERAAEGLKEAGGMCRPMTDADSDTAAMASSELALPERPSNEPPEDSQKQADAQGKVRQRAHYVSLRVEDYNRLDPGEWLNDSLVDFWMQWISRSDPSLSSDFHFFTSHFYTRLSDEGPEKVESWTARKNINIFEKSLIFIPINKDLHWSLCVVVNPGAIIRPDTDDVPKKDDPVPCLIFLDSLRMHTKSKVANTVRGWLNSEWKRLKTTSDVLKPFSRDAFRLFSPTVPYQDNGYDCGVFVCRYAYAIYQLRQRGFTYSDAGLCCDSEEEKKSAAFYHLITEGSEFDFDMDDISLFRDEFQTLIERLSEIHTRWKKEEKAEQRRLKAALQEKSAESVVAEEVGSSKPLPTVSGEKTTEAELAGIERTGKENITSGALDPNLQETPGENIEDGPCSKELPAQTNILEKPRSYVSDVEQFSDPPVWNYEAGDDSQDVDDNVI